VGRAMGIARVWQIQLWVNRQKLFYVKGDKLDATVVLPRGTNQNVVVKAVDSKGVSTRIVLVLTVY